MGTEGNMGTEGKSTTKYISNSPRRLRFISPSTATPVAVDIRPHFASTMGFLVFP